MCCLCCTVLLCVCWYVMSLFDHRKYVLIYICHVSLACAARIIHICHDSSVCVTFLIHMCDMPVQMLKKKKALRWRVEGPLSPLEQDPLDEVKWEIYLTSSSRGVTWLTRTTRRSWGKFSLLRSTCSPLEEDRLEKVLWKMHLTRCSRGVTWLTRTTRRSCVKVPLAVRKRIHERKWSEKCIGLERDACVREAFD